MERTKKDTGILKWRKQGGGSFRMGSGRIIKPGQTFTARLDEIPEAFRDVVIPLDQFAFDKASKVEVGDLTASKYFVQHISSGWYAVVDSDGKSQSEKKLRKDDAEALLQSLS